MMPQLTWSALILAVLAAVACWNPEDRPVCRETRPVFGAGACCERHRAAAINCERAEAACRAGGNPIDRP